MKTFCLMAIMAMVPGVASATDISNVLEDGTFLLGLPNAPMQEYSKGQKFGSWKVDEGKAKVSVNYFSYPDDRSNCVRMPGDVNARISQTFETIPGRNYTVKFMVAGDWDGAPSQQVLKVEAAPLSKDVTIDKPSTWSKTNMGWKEISLPFVAKSTTTTISFSSGSSSKSSLGLFSLFGGRTASSNRGGVVIAQVGVHTPVDPPKALETIPVPTPPDLEKYVSNKAAAIKLGKALFWDMQVGSDGKTACATCHWHAGADARTRNTLNPGAPGSAFGHQTDKGPSLLADAIANFPGANIDLKKDDFPFHRLRDMDRPQSSDNPVIFDTKKVVGSQGVVKKNFVNIVEGNPVDNGTTVADPIFNINGTNTRQVTGRNAPTTINAVFFDRSFWDGRANRYFNGVNPFGDLDPDARVLKWSTTTKQTSKVTGYKWILKWFGWWGYWSYEPVTSTTSETITSLEPVHVLIDNGALASQAVGPPNNNVEVSWNGRTFRDLGRKLFSLKPLALQKVHEDDSVLGSSANHNGQGLRYDASYSQMIRDAFQPEWWAATKSTADGYTQMEANFSMFWGLSIMMYEATLVSDDSPFDRYRKGDNNALSADAKEGLKIFLNEGKCINCHGGPEFAGATVSNLRGVLSDDGPIEFMAMAKGAAVYDGGFYNIGVRQTEEDIGVGASHPQFGPLSYSAQRQNGRDVGSDLSVLKNTRIAVKGAFKTPTLRNIELTGPYFHNGGQKDLLGVVEFYTRGADFKRTNIDDLDPDVDGIPELQGNEEAQLQLVEFMKHLTDERVKYRKAPFDHPELVIPNGHTGVSNGVALDNDFVLPATGRQGGSALMPFEEALESGY